MTSVYVNIVSPTIIYSNFNIPIQNQVTDSTFTDALKADLISALSIHGVKTVTIHIQKNISEFDLYDIVLGNVKNDWQEEKIREEVDFTCITFMKKENLLTLKDD